MPTASPAEILGALLGFVRHWLVTLLIDAVLGGLPPPGNYESVGDEIERELRAMLDAAA